MGERAGTALPAEPETDMPTARIFQRPKNAMQSGKYRTDRWALEFEPAEAKQPDPLTGWAGSGDTRDQVPARFPDRGGSGGALPAGRLGLRRRPRARTDAEAPSLCG